MLNVRYQGTYASAYLAAWKDDTLLSLLNCKNNYWHFHYSTDLDKTFRDIVQRKEVDAENIGEIPLIFLSFPSAKVCICLWVAGSTLLRVSHCLGKAFICGGNLLRLSLRRIFFSTMSFCEFHYLQTKFAMSFYGVFQHTNSRTAFFYIPTWITNSEQLHCLQYFRSLIMVNILQNKPGLPNDRTVFFQFFMRILDNDPYQAHLMLS